MTEKEARQLLPLTIVMWDNNPDDLGTVRSIEYWGVRWGVTIDWENGRSRWIAFQDQDMEKISLR